MKKLFILAGIFVVVFWFISVEMQYNDKEAVWTLFGGGGIFTIILYFFCEETEKFYKIPLAASWALIPPAIVLSIMDMEKFSFRTLLVMVIAVGITIILSWNAVSEVYTGPKIKKILIMLNFLGILYGGIAIRVFG